MIGASAIAAFLLRRGLAKSEGAAGKAAQVISWIGFALILVAVLALGKCAYDRSVIADHETEERAADAEAALEGERRANDGDADRQADFAADQAKTEKGMNDAKASDPEGAAKPVGPVQRGYFDSLPRTDRPAADRPAG